MENESNVLNDLFVSREENICAITEIDKKRIKELTKNNDTYQMLLDKLDELSNDDIAKAKVKDSLESYIDKVNIIGSYENEKFYKIGFVDAMNLIFECIKNLISKFWKELNVCYNKKYKNNKEIKRDEE